MVSPECYSVRMGSSGKKSAKKIMNGSMGFRWLSLEPVGQGALEGLFETCGYDQLPELLLVTAGDQLVPAIPQALAQIDAPILLACATGSTLELGPYFAAGNRSCWLCLARWLRVRRWRQAAKHGWDELDCPPVEVGGIFLDTHANALVAQLKTLDPTQLEAAILRIELEAGASELSPIRRWGGCQCPPEHTYPSLLNFANRTTGIVHNLTPTSQPLCGTYAASAFCYAPLRKNARL